MADISNANVAPNLAVDKLENENVTLISLVVDKSGSMDKYSQAMVQCLDTFKNSLVNSKAADEVLVSLLQFNGSIDSRGFQLVADLNPQYSATGSTALYDAVVVAQKGLVDNGNGYTEQLKKNGIRVKSILAVFSDGEDNASNSSIRDAVDAIALLKQKEILTVFIAFGDAAKGIAGQLGIAPADVLETSATESELRRVFDILSKSAISASKSSSSAVSSGSFFV